MDTMNRRTYLGGSDTAAILGLSPWPRTYLVGASHE